MATLTIEQAKEKMIKELSHLDKVINDFYVTDLIEHFFQIGNYEPQQTYEYNKQKYFQYISKNIS